MSRPKAPSRGLRHGGLLLIILSSSSLAACSGDDELRPEELETLESMVFNGATPASISNQVADSGAAAELGQRLFFDRGMSSDGRVACASCHNPAEAFSDPRPVSPGVRGQLGDRHAPPIVNPGTQTFFLWDGRADSLWSQALMAIENPVEMDFSRAEVAHYIAARYADEYESVFGPLPDLGDIPARAQPGDDAWEDLSDAQQIDVETVFTNAAKAIEAYERQIRCADTRFDQVMRGQGSFSRAEERGAASFVRSGCVNCHGGQQFNRGRDGSPFHNTGSTTSDRGRIDGVDLLLDGEFNRASAFSDDPEAGFEFLARLQSDAGDLGAFKTPSLRGVAQRPRFFHDGSRGSLAEVLDFYRRRPQGNVLGEIDPLLRRARFDEGDMIAFLQTLDCPPLDQTLLGPPGGAAPAPGGGAAPAPGGAPDAPAGGAEPPPGPDGGGGGPRRGR